MTSQVAALPLDPSTRWVVRVTLATGHEITEHALVRMDEQAEQRHDATVAARADGPGLVFTAETASVDVTAVPAWAATIAQDAAKYGVAADISLVELAVSTPEQYEADALRPDVPEVVGVAEVAELLEVSRQRLAVLRGRPGFPAALVELAQGPVWTAEAIETYAARRNRAPGRPPMQDAAAL